MRVGDMTPERASPLFEQMVHATGPQSGTHRFAGGEIRYRAAAFQGKGFRSLGQEAIYAAAIRLRRGGAYRTEHGWRGDVVAPMIRDLGVTLAMRSDADMVRLVLSAQMGKAGPPMNGRDLHVGDFDSGILPATAPLGDTNRGIPVKTQ